jgi:hypothetical protein
MAQSAGRGKLPFSSFVSQSAPGRYVGAAAQEGDGEPFEEKMARLTAQLKAQFEESTHLEITIRENLRTWWND